MPHLKFLLSKRLQCNDTDNVTYYVKIYIYTIREILQYFFSAGTMVNFVALAREHWVNILVPMGFVIGWYLDKQQDKKLTAFRNKSALYSRYEK